MAKIKKALIKKKKNSSLMWFGAQKLMGRVTSEEKERERKLILMTAKVINVSPFGVNILGNLPYVNKLGLQQKVKQYNGSIHFRYEWVNFSENETDKAICKCKLVDGKGKDITDWIVGECSPATMKMGTLAGYQNHMAQTRARNRAILEAYGTRIHEEMMRNVQKLYDQKQVSEQEATQIGTAITTSAEEIQTEEKKKQGQQTIFQEVKPEKSKAGDLFAGDKEKERIKEMAKKKGLDTIKQIEKAIGIDIDFSNMTKKQASIVLFKILELKAKK